MDNKYKKYSSEELAQDQSFIRWVRNKGTEEEATSWKTFLDSNPAKSADIQAAIALVNALSATDVKPGQETVDHLWTDINKKIDTENKRQARRTVVRKIGFGLAAAVAICLAGWWFLFFKAGEISTSYAETREISLPDKSEVILNAVSSLKYDKETYNQGNRLLKLEGEAFFEVEKGAPFIIECKEGRVEVLGTSFNVHSRNKRLTVTCRSGMVKVSDKKGQHEFIISQGQGVTISGKKAEEFLLDSYKIGSWQEGIFYFENSPLKRVFDEIERQFNVDIDYQLENQNDIRYTGYFRNNQLDSALNTVCWPLRLNASVDEKNIVISRE